MRVMRFILLTTSAIITPTLAAADPVSAFIAGFTGSGAAGVAAATASAIGGLTAVGTTSVTADPLPPGPGPGTTAPETSSPISPEDNIEPTTGPQEAEAPEVVTTTTVTPEP